MEEKQEEKQVPEFFDESSLSDVNPFKIGQPRKYTPRALQRKIKEYFDTCDGKYMDKKNVDDPEFIPTVSGLCVWLGVERATLLRWSKEKNDEYNIIANNALNRLRKHWESFLVAKNATGAMFWLRNHGWTADIAGNKLEAEGSNDGKGIKITIRSATDGESVV